MTDDTRIPSRAQAAANVADGFRGMHEFYVAQVGAAWAAADCARAQLATIRESLGALADEVDHGVMHPEVTHPAKCPVCEAVRLIRARVDETL